MLYRNMQLRDLLVPPTKPEVLFHWSLLSQSLAYTWHIVGAQYMLVKWDGRGVKTRMFSFASGIIQQREAGGMGEINKLDLNPELD